MPLAMGRVDCAAYPFQGVGPCPAAHLDQGSPQRVGDVHIAGYLSIIELLSWIFFMVQRRGGIVQLIPDVDMVRGSSGSYLDNYTSGAVIDCSYESN